MSEHHQEGLAHLIYGIKQGGGFVALTGEVGTGKTTLCYCLLQQLPDNVDIALVLNPKLNALELLATICDELSIIYDQDKITLKGLIDNLNTYLLAAYAKGRRTVLMIDEAQNLSLDVLEQIRLLTNLETSKTKLLQIILIGQPELSQLLEKPALRQLNQRITARYHLYPLTYTETLNYIKHRLTVSGGKTEVFSKQAIRKIYKLSQGIPRLINILSDRALLGAYANNSQTVSTKIIDKAAKEVLGISHKSDNWFLKFVLAGLILIVGLKILMPYWEGDEPLKQQTVISKNSKIIVEESGSKLKTIKLGTKPQAVSNSLDFISTIKQQNTPLNVAIPRLAKLWNKNIAETSGCEKVEAMGLQCLLNKTNWTKLIALDRPVIMEFSHNKSEKFYALLLGLKQGNPVFFVNADISFPLDQVLDLWNGYFLMLWQPPVENIKEVYPGNTSDSVIWIRKKITLYPDYSLNNLDSAVFDDELKSQVIKFQQQHQLKPDGIVGPRTFIHLQNTDLKDNSPKLTIIP